MNDRLAELIRKISNPQQLIDTIRRAALGADGVPKDPKAERWLRERGISLEIGADPFPPDSHNKDN